jgi:hypothetical protein
MFTLRDSDDGTNATESSELHQVVEFYMRHVINTGLEEPISKVCELVEVSLRGWETQPITNQPM